ncbi:MAG TPA: hypothetical protein VJK72_01985 [Candidatus Nanoarchaeia archaeon]|nr:hypothetical protein [Candidatus Nanoarchaeia archaeon]
MSAYNNFHHNLPDGWYRGAKGWPDDHPDITIALDNVVEEIGFDFGAFEQLKACKERTTTLNFTIRNNAAEGKRLLTTDETKLLMTVSEEDAEIDRSITRALKPLYNKMREQGFTHEELVQ